MKSSIRLTAIAVLLSSLAYGQLPPLTKFQTIEVSQTSLLNGELRLEPGLLIKGLANFQDQVKFTGLSLQTTAVGIKSVLVLNTDGAVVETPFPNFTKLIRDVDTGSDCIVDINGNLVTVPATWQYKDNLIYTHRCAPNAQVGIGTSNPRERLEVNGNALFAGGIKAARTDNPVGAAHVFGGKMLIGGDPGKNTNLNKFLELGFDGANTYLNSKGADVLLINYYDSKPVVIGDDKIASPAMLVANGGLRVGAKAIGTAEIIGKGELIVMGKDGYTSSGHQASIYFGDQNSYITKIKGNGLFLSGNGSVSDIVLKENGRLGIGISNPGASLHIKSSGNPALLVTGNGGDKLFMVDGKTYAVEVNVRPSFQFPDYVFHKDYKLMSLDDLSSYIQKNQKLPKLPTAEKVEVDGIDVGEMNRLLVEKVEELTLYILQLKEELDEVKKEIKDSK